MKGDDAGIEDLIGRADAALYAAKKPLAATAWFFDETRAFGAGGPIASL